jgi:hypothetical protein
MTVSVSHIQNIIDSSFNNHYYSDPSSEVMMEEMKLCNPADHAALAYLCHGTQSGVPLCTVRAYLTLYIVFPILTTTFHNKYDFTASVKGHQIQYMYGRYSHYIDEKTTVYIYLYDLISYIQALP